ncbi:TOBE domain-containing protein [Streptomyces sp. RB6PN25]|uniref:TOBE domain-containing protein n=1 Tax=Streptomyces humicola TaxID=2953240 RepID=A0ABT1Q8A1_9ACTN|nr:TOBE domain-containing protein [Streptomyces humicola]MCQ4085012.1 TOBE domain-containing protein [Streptomyces humicola]
MDLSIRNQLPGTVTAVTQGEAVAAVRTRLAGGQEITAVVTVDAVKELGIDEGTAVRVLIKSTEVALATERVDGISIRNQILGKVEGVTTGGAMAIVRIEIDGGRLTAAITNEAASDLGLFAGSSVVALIKSTEVSLATGAA